ncbi:hypothetical protein CRM22_008924 [Opisthorchis felineus]|uniref:Acetoacetyl-CoA synthetase n=1 Tax=Opisthorchis felineus TaxID=147828 RepID=A0A4S2L9Q6_OPIFE|nr:hypothetical protein CRM22_008924 [Opisthorchis felineus]
MSTTLWTPSSNSGISMLEFMHFVEQKHNLNFGGDYHKFYTWSIEQLNQFWLDFFFHTCVRHSVPPTRAIDTTTEMSSIPKWFPECRLNYAENILSGGKPSDVALLAFCEGRDHVIKLTFGELQRQVILCARSLQHIGVKPGDRVAGLFPNCVEAVICYLATSYIGAIWSSAPPDFGVKGIVQRFSMVLPTVLFAVTRTVYRGKTFDQTPKVIELVHALEPQLKHVILVPFLELFDVATNDVKVDKGPSCPDADVSSIHLISDECFFQMRTAADVRLSEYLTSIPHSCTLQQFLKLGQVGDSDNSEIGPVQLPFSHPMVIMFSSGTTGPPKCIVHSGGGTLIKHMCEQKLHSDIRPGDRLLYLTNVGWMMWNWLVSVLALGCSAVLYEGCPFDSRLWAMIDYLGVTALGTSAKWLAVLEDRGLKPVTTGPLISVKHLQFQWGQITAQP